MFKIVSEKVSQLLKSLKFNPPPKQSFRERIEQIFKDLNRLVFFKTTSKTFQDAINAWTTAASFSYRQGNMDASIVSILLKRMYYGNPKYPDPPKVKDLSFSYFNDKGHLCALSISYLDSDPKIWVAGVISNACQVPSKRTMTLVGTDAFLSGTNGFSLKNNEVASAFLNSLHSKELETRLKDLISPNGTLNIGELELINEHIESIHAECNPQVLVENKKGEYQLIKEYFDKHYSYAEIQAINDKKREVENKLAAINGMKQEHFEYLLSQSFYQRHINKFRFLGIASLTAISLLLILSGVFAPLGLSLTAGISLLVTISLGVNAFSIVFTGIKMAYEAFKLNKYQKVHEELTHEYDHLISEARLLQSDYDILYEEQRPLFENLCKVLLKEQFRDKSADEIEELIRETIVFLNHTAEDGMIEEHHYTSPIRRSKSMDSFFDKKEIVALPESNLTI